MDILYVTWDLEKENQCNTNIRLIPPCKIVPNLLPGVCAKFLTCSMEDNLMLVIGPTMPPYYHQSYLHRDIKTALAKVSPKHELCEISGGGYLTGIFFEDEFLEAINFFGKSMDYDEFDSNIQTAESKQEIQKVTGKPVVYREDPLPTRPQIPDRSRLENPDDPYAGTILRRKGDKIVSKVVMNPKEEEENPTAHECFTKEEIVSLKKFWESDTSPEAKAVKCQAAWDKAGNCALCRRQLLLLMSSAEDLKF